jgi:hypothetical protein
MNTIRFMTLDLLISLKIEEIFVLVKADGFYSQKVKIEKEIRLILLNLKLKKGDDYFKMAGRYVNAGYGYVDAKRLLNSVSSLNKNDIDFSVYVNMYD